MATKSTINPLSGGSLTITDPERKPYPDAWIGMADDLDPTGGAGSGKGGAGSGKAKWLRVGGIAEGDTARLALDADVTRVIGNLGVRRAPEAALDVEGDAHVRGGLQIDTKLGVHRAPETALDVDGDARVRGSLRIDTRLGVGRDPHAVRPLATEGHEIHSGGTGAGFSFGNRGSTGDVEALDGLAAGSRWVFYSVDKQAHLWTNQKGNVLTVTPSGDVHFTGQLHTVKQSLFSMWSQEMVVQNAGRDRYAEWAVSYAGVFRVVYGAFAVLGGFSLFQMGDPTSFANATGAHYASAGAIPQHVYARVTEWTNTGAKGHAYCSESDASGEADNCVYFTVVVFGAPPLGFTV
jgi:hypothetical protein